MGGGGRDGGVGWGNKNVVGGGGNFSRLGGLPPFPPVGKTLLINEKSGDDNSINTWHQEPHFIHNQKQTLQALTLQTYGFVPLKRWHHDLRKGVILG